jgi:hypothetical protein
MSEGRPQNADLHVWVDRHGKCWARIESSEGVEVVGPADYWLELFVDIAWTSVLSRGRIDALPRD